MAEHSETRRVALVASSYHPYFGGVEEHVRHVAAEIAAQGHRVEVWTVDRGEHLGEQVVDGITVRYLPTPLPARRLPNLARFGLTAPVALARWIHAARTFRPTVLHVHCFGPNGPYAMAVASLLRLPLIVTSHGETFADEHSIFTKSALLRRALTRACQTAAAVTGVSSLVTDDLNANYGAKEAQIIPNGVRIRPLSESIVRTPGRLVGVGRFVHVKGFDLLLRGLASSNEGGSVQLIGDGPERTSLEALAAELNIADRVDFLGRLSGDEVHTAMQSATAVVVPSRREAFGIVALEAWASRTALIATSTGGPAGFVTDGVDGILVDPEDTEALAAAIDDVVGSPTKARDLVAQGAQTVQGFTWDRVADAYAALYRSVATLR